jgi:putative flippase GtrA
MVRYGLVGLLAVAVHYTVLIGLVELDLLSKVPASIAGFCMATPVNYYFQHVWVFRSDRAHATALPRYLGVTSAGLAINALAFNAGLELGVPYLLAQAIAIALVTAFNFTANRFYTFSAEAPVQP